MSTEERVTRLETVIENINGTLIRLETGQAEIKKEMVTGFSDIRKEMTVDFRWLLAVMGALFGIMGRGFHWF